MRRCCFVLVLRVVIASLVTLSMALAPRGAAAQTGDDADRTRKAAELKRKADADFDNFRFAEALEAYTTALGLTPTADLVYNRGRALQALRWYPEALADFERFGREASTELRARVPQLEALIAEVRAKTSSLHLRASVAGARVVVKEAGEGKTPWTTSVTASREASLRTIAGAVTLLATVEGYEPVRRDLTMPSGGVLELDIVFTRNATTETLVVRATPAEALVQIDGRALGRQPIDVRVGGGTHKVRVTQSGYEPAETVADVKLGEPKLVSLTLSKEAPVTARWWFWTSVGVVVVGGAVLTVALLKEKDPPRGDIAPGQVRF